MKPESVSTWFEKIVTQQDEKTAITFWRNSLIETELTYAALNQDINQFANTLIDLNVKKGDRVILFIEKSLIAVTAHFALQKLGAVAVPLNPGFKKNELEYLLDDADAQLVITDPEKKVLIRTIDPNIRIVEITTQKPYQKIDFFRSAPASAPVAEINADDPGLIIYTSGTTGNPKGAVLTQENLVHDARNIIKIWEISDKDVLCHALPLFHVHGLCFALHTALFAGAQVIMPDQFKPDLILKLLSEKCCTVFMAVPAMYTTLTDHLEDKPLPLPSMRLMTSGSAPLLVKAFERIKTTFGLEPVEREGMSETGMNFSNPVKGQRKPGSIGLPLPNVRVRIVDHTSFKDVSPGTVGEIWLKSPSITPGYWRKPEETAAAFENGWFRTGDLGKTDEDGYYYLTDRIKHIIITGGENVSAKEVETVINRIDGVVESCVVGLADLKWGEKVAAAVVALPAANIDDTDIKAFCKVNLHNWKCPKEIKFVDEIPKNTMGKVLKEQVKRIFRNN